MLFSSSRSTAVVSLGSLRDTANELLIYSSHKKLLVSAEIFSKITEQKYSCVENETSGHYLPKENSFNILDGAVDFNSTTDTATISFSSLFFFSVNWMGTFQESMDILKLFG